MATRSTISIKNPDGTFKTIYCHYDGYLSYNGQVLTNFYNDKKTVDQLIELGDLSSLGNNPVSSPNLWKEYDSSNEYCKAYKDREGEDWNIIKPKTLNSLEDIDEEFRDCEYHYIFDNGTWYYFTDNVDDLRKVEDDK